MFLTPHLHLLEILMHVVTEDAITARVSEIPLTAAP